MRSTLASASRGLGELKSKELEQTIGMKHHTMAQFKDFFGSASDKPDARSAEQPTQGDSLSRTGKVGLTSSSCFIGASSTWLARHEVVGKADRQTSLDRHNEYDAKTTSDCGVV